MNNQKRSNSSRPKTGNKINNKNEIIIKKKPSKKENEKEKYNFLLNI